MAIFSKILVAAALSVLSATAFSQIVPTGQFTGQQSDGFETQNSPGFPLCIVGRVFNSTADLCDNSGASQNMHITSGWGFFCSIGPHGGGRFAGSAGGPAEYAFDQTATRFGGFFGTNSGVADARAEFYDAAGQLISTATVVCPADCTWTWNGWQVLGGPAIKRVKIVGINGYNGGGFIDMDDMQVDYGTPCPGPVTYCTPKVNSLGCTPGISATGNPSATAPSGLLVRSVNMRNHKPGLLIYGVNGRANLPFRGGFLCIAAPVKRTPPSDSGGNALPTIDCSGVYNIDMNSLAQGLLGGGQPLPALRVPGTTVCCQFWAVDSGFPAPDNVGLSDALEYVVCP